VEAHEEVGIRRILLGLLGPTVYLAQVVQAFAHDRGKKDATGEPKERAFGSVFPLGRFPIPGALSAGLEARDFDSIHTQNEPAVAVSRRARPRPAGGLGGAENQARENREATHEATHDAVILSLEFTRRAL